MGPIIAPVSAAENAVPSPSAESQGRRTLSTAFVMVGPDGHLMVKLRDERVLILHNVVMGHRTYCGVQVRGGNAGAKYCGGYAEIAAARAGGGAAPAHPDLAPADPVEASLNPAKRK